jgi:hypothetical protein
MGSQGQGPAPDGALKCAPKGEVKGMDESQNTAATEPPAKAARRKKAPRDRISTFRSTKADHELCKRKAKAQGKTLSEYAVMAMLNRRDRRPCVPEINKASHAMLGRAVGSLNQMALVLNRAAAESQKPTAEMLREVLGPKADAWLTEMAAMRDEIKQLRTALVGVGLVDQDRTLSGLNEAEKARLDTRNLFDPEHRTDREIEAANASGNGAQG